MTAHKDPCEKPGCPQYLCRLDRENRAGWICLAHGNKALPVCGLCVKPDQALDVAVHMRLKAEKEQQLTYECNERQQKQIGVLLEQRDAYLEMLLDVLDTGYNTKKEIRLRERIARVKARQFDGGKPSL